MAELKMFKKFVILGDFDIDYACYNCSSVVKNCADNNASHGCEQLITWPTRTASTRLSILNHIYVDSCIMINDVATVTVIEH